MAAPRDLIQAFESEYLRYKKLAEDVMAQLADAELAAPGPGGTNSVVVLVWHISGNLRSRFTDFLTSDGEKPWRQREEEFVGRQVSRNELLAKWQQGWNILVDSLHELDDARLGQMVTIRQQPLPVREALLRSLAHVALHVGQILLIARAARGGDWKFLSIPPGQSETYNRAPTLERPPKAGA
jgi:hypothetical protein